VPKDEWYGVFRRAIFEHEHDEERLLAYVAALQHTSSPGFMRNAITFPEALDPENVRNLARALASAAGLSKTSPANAANADARPKATSGAGSST
jgi:hypothetical protein